MKRFTIAVCIFLITIIFSITSYFTICNRIDSVIRLMKTDRETIVATTKIEPLRTEKIIEEWDKHEVYLVSTLAHHELEEIEIGMRCLHDYMQQGFTEEYIKTLNECINYLEHVKATEKPDIKNIF